MTASRDSDQAQSDAVRAWYIGGSLCIAAVVVGIAVQPLATALVGANYLSVLLICASLLVFALGIRGSGSVTARRPLGTAAVIILALSIVLAPALSTLLIFGESSIFGDLESRSGSLLPFGYVGSFVQFGIALIAVTQIARSGAVPRPWNLAPAWCLLAVAVPWVIGAVVEAAGWQQRDAPLLTALIVTLDSLARLGTPVLLGVIAIALAARSRPSS